MVLFHWHRIRKCLYISGLVAIASFLVAIWWVGGSLVALANRIIGPPLNDFPAVTVEILPNSGATLAAWHLAVPGAQGTVILLHPIQGDRRWMLSRARILNQRGYCTLLVDLQSHGESEGKKITMGYWERLDVLATVEYVRRSNPNYKIAIIGRSLGGAATLLATPEVDLIVLESVYPTITQAVRNRLAMRIGLFHHVVAPLLLIQLKPRLGITPDQLCPIDRLGEIYCPVVIVSGDRDLHTSIQETKRIYEAANHPKRLVVFKGAQHVDLLAYDKQKYL